MYIVRMREQCRMSEKAQLQIVCGNNAIDARSGGFHNFDDLYMLEDII